MDLTAVLCLDHHVAILGAGDGLHAAVLLQLHAALCQDGLEDVGRIGVVMRQDAVTGRHHGYAHAHFREGGDKLGAGNAGTDDDEVLRLLLKAIDLLPGKDSLAVRLRARQDARGGAGGDEDEVSVERLGGAVIMSHINPMGSARDAVLILRERRAAINNLDADFLQTVTHVLRLVAGKCLHTAVERLQVQLQRAELVIEPHVIGTAEVGLNICAGNKGL